MVLWFTRIITWNLKSLGLSAMGKLLRKKMAEQMTVKLIENKRLKLSTFEGSDVADQTAPDTIPMWPISSKTKTVIW